MIPNRPFINVHVPPEIKTVSSVLFERVKGTITNFATHKNHYIGTKTVKVKPTAKLVTPIVFKLRKSSTP